MLMYQNAQITQEVTSPSRQKQQGLKSGKYWSLKLESDKQYFENNKKYFAYVLILAKLTRSYNRLQSRFSFSGMNALVFTALRYILHQSFRYMLCIYIYYEDGYLISASYLVIIRITQFSCRPTKRRNNFSNPGNKQKHRQTDHEDIVEEEEFSLMLSGFVTLQRIKNLIHATVADQSAMWKRELLEEMTSKDVRISFNKPNATRILKTISIVAI